MTSSRPSSAASSSAAQRQQLRGPLDRDRPTPTAPSTRVATARYSDVGLAVTSKKDADGNPIGTADPLAAARTTSTRRQRALYQRTGPDAAVGHPAATCGWTSPSRSSSSCSQLALSSLADKVEHERRRRPTNEEIAQSLRENHGVVKFDGVEYAFGGVESLLGAADNPDEVLIALYHGGAELRRRRRGARAAAAGQQRRAADHQRAKLLTASAKTSVWRSTSAAVVVGAISAML